MTDIALDIHLDEQYLSRALRADALAGLTARPKQLPPTWFYDERGGALFEQITRLPEYYPTRAELAILAARAGEVAAVTRAKTLIELGSGSAEKLSLLLDAFDSRDGLGSVVPLDVSEAALRATAGDLAARYPRLAVRGVVADFTRQLDVLPSGGGRLVAFLGGTIGNLRPAQRAAFLADLRAQLDPGEWFLLGTDLVKSPAVLVPAYDDAAGVTAEFNRNVLRVLDRELGADFDPDAFDHVALWNAAEEWIEMRLRARHAMTVRLPAIDLTVTFEAGEDLLTEVSAKFRRGRLRRELADAGFAVRRWWTDPENRFGVTLAQAQP